MNNLDTQKKKEDGRRGGKRGRKKENRKNERRLKRNENSLEGPKVERRKKAG